MLGCGGRAGVRLLRKLGRPGLCVAEHARHLSCTRSLSRLHDFQKKKILTEFETLYDRDKDGFVDKKDIEAYKKVLYDYYSSTRGQNLHQTVPAYDDYWTLFTELADANHDGKISRDEWVDIWTHISDNARDQSFRSLPQWVQLMPRVIFPIMDYNDDGVLDEKEYSRFWYEVGGIQADSTVISKCLQTMSQDGSKPVNISQFEELYADFYLSSSQNSPGKYVGGGPQEYD